MSEDQNKAAKVIDAASKAIEKITDPAKRHTAETKLKQMRKSAAKAVSRPTPSRMDLDSDFER